MSERRDTVLRLLCATASTIYKDRGGTTGMHCFCSDNPIRADRDHTFEWNPNILDIMIRGALHYAKLPYEGSYRQILTSLRPECPNCPSVEHETNAHFCHECGSALSE